MNPDKCQGCHQLCDPYDSEYCIWEGHRWHVSCALKQVSSDIEVIREKQGRFDTNAANYSALQVKIDNMMDAREGLINILREVPEQAQQLGKLSMRSGDKLIRRVSGGHHAGGGHLLDGEDSRNLFRLSSAERAQIEHRDHKLLEEVI